LSRLFLLVTIVLATLVSTGCPGQADRDDRHFEPRVLFVDQGQLRLLEGSENVLLFPQSATDDTEVVRGTISSTGSLAVLVSAHEMILISVPEGKELARFPFEVPSDDLDFFGGPSITDNERRMAFAIPGLIGDVETGAVHILIHQLALDGSGGGTPIPLPPTDNLITVLDLSFDSSKGIAWAGSTFVEAKPTMYSLDFQKLEVTEIKGEIVPLSPPLMSLRGDRAYVTGLDDLGDGQVGEKPELYEVDIESGGVKRLTRLSEAGIPRPLDVGDDGRLLYSYTPESALEAQQLRILDLSNNRSRLLNRLDRGQQIFQASVSPKGDEVSYIMCSAGCELRRLQLTDLTEEVLGSFTRPEGAVGFLLPSTISWYRVDSDST